MRKERLHLLFFLLLCTPDPAAARSIRGNLYVKEGDQTMAAIGATIELLSAKDSSVICGTQATEHSGFKRKNYHYSLPVENKTRYILRFSLIGFQTEYRDVYVDMPEKLSIQQVPTVTLKETVRQLKEVVVRSTQIKMVLKGDTIIYNADAFKLAEGSMLDALLRQLPGARLQGGNITVNGRHVNALLLDGREFFHGDAQMALKNLPAYTVHRVKVYERAGRASRLMERDMGDKDYVMDVRLKKKYQNGLMANVDLGGGTEGRYQERLYSMFYSPKHTLTLSGNLNNIGENGPVSQDYAESMPSVEGFRPYTQRVANLNYRYNGKTVDDHFSTMATLSNGRGTLESRTSAQNFLSGGDNFDLSRRTDRSRGTSLNSSSLGSIRLSRQIIGARVSILHNSSKSEGAALNGTFNENPIWAPNLIDSLFASGLGLRLQQALINRTLARSQLDERQTDVTVELNTDIALRGRGRCGKARGESGAKKDLIRLMLSGGFTNSHSERFELSKLDYFGGGTPSAMPVASDHQHRYTDAPNRSRNAKLRANWSRVLTRATDKVNNLNLNIQAQAGQDYKSTRSSLYRLDQINAYSESAYPLGMLPSQREELQQVLNATNSYRSTEHCFHESNVLGLYYTRSRGMGAPRLELKTDLQVSFRREHLKYFRVRDYDMRRSYVNLGTVCSAIYSTTDSLRTRRYQFDYNTSPNRPLLTSLIGTLDNSDPLHVRLGNPDLKTARNHSFRLDFSQMNMDAHMSHFNMHANLMLSSNQMAVSRIYDKQTGVTTSQSVNVNGNWSAGLNAGYGLMADEDQTLRLDFNVSGNYSRNVDLVQVLGASAHAKSAVNTYMATAMCSGTYTPSSKFMLTGTLMAAPHISTGTRADFTTMRSWRGEVMLNLTYRLPWDVELDTKIFDTFQTGYNDPALNTNSFVWNLRASKSILRKRLTFALEAYDLLRQVKSTTLTVNEQGRVETWNNTVPRYIMAHVVYKFYLGKRL